MRGKQKTTTTGRDSDALADHRAFCHCRCAVSRNANQQRAVAVFLSMVRDPGDGNGPGGAMSCYYTSWEQCRTTMSGIGGNCVESPYYHAQSTLLPHRSVVKPRHRRHA
jgi:hypothetical protein